MAESTLQIVTVPTLGGPHALLIGDALVVSADAPPGAALALRARWLALRCSEAATPALDTM